MMLWMTAPKSKFLSKGTLGIAKTMGRPKNVDKNIGGRNE